MGIKNQTLDIEQYTRDIGLDSRLIHAPKDKKQADGLLSIEKSLMEYESKVYTALVEQNTLRNDPQRDLISTLDKIQAIEDYLVKYYDVPMLFSREIQSLHKLADQIQNFTHFTSNGFVKYIMKGIVSELTDLGFSENMINKGTRKGSALKSVFKSILTES